MKKETRRLPSSGGIFYMPVYSRSAYIYLASFKSCTIASGNTTSQQTDFFQWCIIPYLCE